MKSAYTHMCVRRAGILLAAVFLLVSTCLAQTPTGTIRGEVTDPSGARVSGAIVKITDTATKRTIDVTTNQVGLFTAPLLLPGVYTVEITAQGFAKYETRVIVQAGQIMDASAKLAVGSEKTTVQVEATAELVRPDTSRATVDGVITAAQIDNQPLNARNFLELAALEPGVLIRDGGSIDPTKDRVYRTVGILGKSGTSTRVQVDGIDITDETVGTTTANISDDAVQEFQLSRSSVDLSTSLTTSGAVSIITKPGTNALHGSFFEYYRNQDMAARIGYLPDAQPFKRHQIGFRLGGPLKKDKLFWFVNWERTYQTEQGIYTTTNKMPVVAGHDCTQGCAGGSPLSIRMATGRLDWNITGSTRFFYRFGHDWNIATGGAVPNSPYQNLDWNNNHIFGLDITKGRFSHSFRFGYVNFNNNIISKSFSGWDFFTTQGAPYYLDVGPAQLGPNSLAPQATYQDNYQTKYDGSFAFGKHALRFGGEVNHIVLGGFANFAGPLTIGGDFSQTYQGDLSGAGLDPKDPFNYPLSYFSMGPDNGFFTVAGCHNLPHGCHPNTRYAWYVGDTYRPKSNLAITAGVRWTWDSNFFNNEKGITRPTWLNYFMPYTSEHPVMPKTKFGPQLGFAWDPKGNGKTSIRGGASINYEMNIQNNTMFDQAALIPNGIGPDIWTQSGVKKPDGTPITPAIAGINISSLTSDCQSAAGQAAMNKGIYDCMLSGQWGTYPFAGMPVSAAVPIIGLLNKAMKDSYNNYAFNPSTGTIQLITNQGNVYGGIFNNHYFKNPYAIQWNFGVQREIKPGHLLTADLLINHGVHQGYLLEDTECRKCANTLNQDAAWISLAKRIGVPIDAVTQLPTVQPGSAAWQAAMNAYMTAHSTYNITNFAMGGDSIFQGRTPDPNATDPVLQNTNFLRMRIAGDGGFSKYRGLQVKLTGRFHDVMHLKNVSYIGSWAYGISEATNASTRTEFQQNATYKFHPTDRMFFGPSALDFRHMISAGVSMDTIAGFRLTQTWRFHTARPFTLGMPLPYGTPSGSNGAIFTQDWLGIGTTGTTPNTEPLPGTRYGAMNRDITSWNQLNQAIGSYNANYAGKPTPAGQALVSAGLFTTAQLTALKAVLPYITPVPTSNPWPFNNFINLDLGISRPIKLSRIHEGVEVLPWVQFFNTFNNNTDGIYSGLGGATAFGALNFDYMSPFNQASCAPLTCREALRQQTQGRQNDNRMVQIGVRVNF